MPFWLFACYLPCVLQRIRCIYRTWLQQTSRQKSRELWIFMLPEQYVPLHAFPPAKAMTTSVDCKRRGGSSMKLRICCKCLFLKCQQFKLKTLSSGSGYGGSILNALFSWGQQFHSMSKSVCISFNFPFDFVFFHYSPLSVSTVHRIPFHATLKSFHFSLRYSTFHFRFMFHFPCFSFSKKRWTRLADMTRLPAWRQVFTRSCWSSACKRASEKDASETKGDNTDAEGRASLFQRPENVGLLKLPSSGNTNWPKRATPKLFRCNCSVAVLRFSPSERSLAGLSVLSFHCLVQLIDQIHLQGEIPKIWIKTKTKKLNGYDLIWTHNVKRN